MGNEIIILSTSINSNNLKPYYPIDNKIQIISPEELQEKRKSYLFSKVLRRINYSLLKIKNIHILENAYYPPKMRRKYLSYFRTNKFDAIVGVEGKYAALLGLISNSIDSKCFGWMHNSYQAYYRTPKYYYWNQEYLFKKELCKLNKCIVLTKSDVNQYKREMKVECEAIYNPLSFRVSKKSLCEENVLLFVGRLEYDQKGLGLLVDIMSEVTKYVHNWKLNIVGDGPGRERMQREIYEKGLDRYIHFLGERRDVQSMYLGASIFLLPSKWEGFGLVVTEAMECGLPVVSFNTEGPSEIIQTGINGFLVDKYDVQQFAGRVLELIYNIDRRKKMSQNAMERAKDFSISIVSKKWMDIFNIS